MKMFSVQVAGESISIQAQIILLLRLKNTLLVRKHALGRQLLILLGLFAGAPIPPCLSMCPFTAALQCRPIPIVPPELPKTPPGSWIEGGTTTCPPDHLGPPVGARAVASNVSRPIPTKRPTAPAIKERSPRQQLQISRRLFLRETRKEEK